MHYYMYSCIHITSSTRPHLLTGNLRFFFIPPHKVSTSNQGESLFYDTQNCLEGSIPAHGHRIVMQRFIPPYTNRKRKLKYTENVIECFLRTFTYRLKCFIYRLKSQSISPSPRHHVKIVQKCRRVLNQGLYMAFASCFQTCCCCTWALSFAISGIDKCDELHFDNELELH